MPILLELDHASLSVGGFDAARQHLEATLGFRVTLTPSAPSTHGRIFLDRGYVEVWSPQAAPGTSSPAMTWTMYFVRPPDMSAFVAQARADGIAVSDPGIYHGHDGEWLDASLRYPDWDSILPIVVRRTAPAAIAADWPPALAEPHPNGARTLDSVYVASDDAPAVARLMAKAAGASAPERRASPRWRCDEHSVHLPGGRSVRVLHQPGNAMVAVTFGVADLARTQAHFAERGIAFSVNAAAGGDTLWLDASATGAHIGFTARV